MHEGYCVKDKQKVKFEGEEKTAKNGKKMAQGPCPNCGTKVTTFLKG